MLGTGGRPVSYTHLDVYKRQLLVQPCEVTLNEKTFDLEVRPRDVEPRLEADCYAEMELPGVRQLEAFWRSSLATSANRVNPFETSTFDGTLKSAVGHLDPSGSYEVRTEDVTDVYKRQVQVNARRLGSRPE